MDLIVWLTSVTSPAVPLSSKLCSLNFEANEGAWPAKLRLPLKGVEPFVFFRPGEETSKNDRNQY
jgi:hypothetical protein